MKNKIIFKNDEEVMALNKAICDITGLSNEEFLSIIRNKGLISGSSVEKAKELYNKIKLENLSPEYRRCLVNLYGAIEELEFEIERLSFNIKLK